MSINNSKKIFVLDAPSNLGLRPPVEGAVPGCYKLPWALRNERIIEKLHAEDCGCVIPGQYIATWKPGDGDRNAKEIASFSILLANKLNEILKFGLPIIVLGGDCSIILGIMLSLKRLGRYGIISFDAHSDFRHLGNSNVIGSAAGEDIALITKRGDNRLINLENRGPYVLDQDVYLIGVRQEDECLKEIESLGIQYYTSQSIMNNPNLDIHKHIIDQFSETEGFWIHIDFDVVDSSENYAVDCPESNGLSFAKLTELLKEFVKSSKFIGLDLAIYDPDLDLEGKIARKIVNVMENSLKNS